MVNFDVLYDEMFFEAVPANNIVLPPLFAPVHRVRCHGIQSNRTEVRNSNDNQCIFPCTTEKAVLKSDLVSASDEAILRVQTYNVPKIRGDVNIVVKE